MDNAAKVLIIAGGILIAMLVISLSMYMLTMFRDAYSQSSQLHSTYEINAFNSYFNKYSGQIKGADAYNILSKVDEVNRDEYSIIPSIETNGTVTTANYKEHFFFTERLLDDYSYQFYYNSQGIVYRIDLSELNKIVLGG